MLVHWQGIIKPNADVSLPSQQLLLIQCLHKWSLTAEYDDYERIHLIEVTYLLKLSADQLLFLIDRGLGLLSSEEIRLWFLLTAKDEVPKEDIS